MDISTLLPFLTNNGGGGNNLMSLLPSLLGQQQSQNQNTGQAPTASSEPTVEAQRVTLYDTNPQYLKRYYSDRTSFSDFDDTQKNAHTQNEQHEKKDAQSELNELLKKSGGQSNNANESSNNGGGLNPASLLGLMNNGGNNGGGLNPASLLGLMNNGGNNGGGLNPMSLLNMLGGMNGNRKQGSNVSTASLNANLTKPIEIFAPSKIVLNIRKLLK